MASEPDWSEPAKLYSALPTPTSIRLLKVDPTLLPIQCHFKVVDLNDIPVYSALSYTWGNPRSLIPPGEDVETDRLAMDKKHRISCEGHCVEVTANCHAFLLQFQKLHKAVAERKRGIQELILSTEYIWIDAICINQQSETERASQVGVMDRIYRQAQQVLIWLGCQDTLSSHGFSAILQLAKAFPGVAEVSPESMDRVAGHWQNPSLLKRLGLSNINRNQWQGLLCLYHRTWFRRGWTVQEFALARDAVVICGNVVTRWAVWKKAAHFLFLTNWLCRVLHTNDEEPGNSWSTQMSTIRAQPNHFDIFNQVLQLDVIRYLQILINQQQHQTRSDDEFPLQTVLERFCKSKTSLPEDRIYAFLGLVPKDSWAGLTIDYQRPITETYTQTTLVMIRSTRSLRILSYVEERSLKKIADLPSWVPEYTGKSCMLVPNQNDTDSDSELCDVTGGSAYEFNLSDMLSKSLIVSGALYSVVSDTGEGTPNESVNTVPEYFVPSRSMLNCIRKLPHDHYWRTLISGHDIWLPGREASAVTARYIFQHWIRSLIDGLQKIIRIKSDAKAPPTVIQSMEGTIKKAFISYVILSREYRYLQACNDHGTNGGEGLSFEEICRYIKEAYQNSLHISIIAEKKCSIELEDDENKIGSRIQHAMSYRRLFIDNNQQIGKGPVSTQVGDEIWILRGAEIPYVLRPRGKTNYELIGQAYVHNIMFEGSVEDLLDASETITLI